MLLVHALSWDNRPHITCDLTYPQLISFEMLQVWRPAAPLKLTQRTQMSLCAAQLRLCPVAKARSLPSVWQTGALQFSQARVRAVCRSHMVCASANAAPGWTIVGGGRVGEALADMGESDVRVHLQLTSSVLCIVQW